MSVADFVVTDGVEPPIDDYPAEPEFACEICGVPLEYSGKGRKPKRCEDHKGKRTAASGPSRATSTRDVKAALAVLDGMYSSVSLGLFMLSPTAASVWANQLDQLQAANSVTLAGDPALAKSICRLGERTGKAMFFVSHVVAVAPVAVALQKDFASRDRRPKQTPKPAAREEQPANGTPAPDFGALNPRFPLG